MKPLMHRVFGLGLLAALGLQALPPVVADTEKDKPVTHRFLAGDKGMVRIIDAKGETEWEIENKYTCHNLEMLPNGNVLMPVSNTKLVEVNKDKKTVWSYESKPKEGYKGKVEVHSFQRLADGNTLISESGNTRLIEVNPKGEIIKELALKVKSPSAHRDTRMVRKLSTGNYLVCQESDGIVKEYDPNGNVVWSYTLDLAGRPASPGHGVEGHGINVFGAIRLPNGNTLIGGGNNNRVLEVNKAGEIVWKLDQDELPGIKFAWITTLHYLPNGNIVVGNCHAGPTNPQLFEVTRDKKVVWKFQDQKRFGNDTVAAQILDVDGVIR